MAGQFLVAGSQNLGLGLDIQGSVVQSVNEFVKGHFVNCFSGFNKQYSEIFCGKNVRSVCTAKATRVFAEKNFSIFAYHFM